MDIDENYILFFDKCLAHGIYAGNYFKEYDCNFVVSNSLTITDLKTSKNIMGAILFIYDNQDHLLYELLPDLGNMPNLVLCVETHNLEWLRIYYPELSVLDIGIPKSELFAMLEEYLALHKNIK